MQINLCCPAIPSNDSDSYPVQIHVHINTPHLVDGDPLQGCIFRTQLLQPLRAISLHPAVMGTPPALGLLGGR